MFDDANPGESGSTGPDQPAPERGEADASDREASHGGAGSAGGSGSVGGAGSHGEAGTAGGSGPPSGPPSGPRSWLSGPLGNRLIGAVFAVAGVGLLVVGLLTLRGRPADEDERPPGAASTTTAPSTDQASTPTSARPTASPTPSPRPPATTRPTRPPPPARAPLTVLNNSTRTGLADRASGQFAAAGWRVSLVGNFSGRIPATTVYFTPGNAAQERAARQLAREFPAIDRVLPRLSGLPPTPPGLVVVLTRTWPA